MSVPGPRVPVTPLFRTSNADAVSVLCGSCGARRHCRGRDDLPRQLRVAAFARDLGRHTSGEAGTVRDHGPLPGAHHVEAFLEMMSAERGASGNTLSSYRRDLADYGRFLARAGNDYVSADPAAVRRYLVDLDDRGFAAASAARRLSAMRQLHQFL